jgi:hypothetical protein
MPKEYAMITRAPCCVCGLDTFRHSGWFLVQENRWLDRLKILSWHASLAQQRDVQSVCGRAHLKVVVNHWLTRASERLPQTEIHAAAKQPSPEIDLESETVDNLVGELAVHRDSFSRVWSGSPGALECILDALITISAENKRQTLEFQLFPPFQSPLPTPIPPGPTRL